MAPYVEVAGSPMRPERPCKLGGRVGYSAYPFLSIPYLYPRTKYQQMYHHISASRGSTFFGLLKSETARSEVLRAFSSIRTCKMMDHLPL
jgi:hypothetical protein